MKWFQLNSHGWSAALACVKGLIVAFCCFAISSCASSSSHSVAGDERCSPTVTVANMVSYKWRDEYVRWKIPVIFTNGGHSVLHIDKRLFDEHRLVTIFRSSGMLTPSVTVLPAESFDENLHGLSIPPGHSHISMLELYLVNQDGFKRGEVYFVEIHFRGALEDTPEKYEHDMQMLQLIGVQIP